MSHNIGYSGLAIADYFIEQANQKQIPITNMAVLKMIYFAHGLSYPTLGRKLITDPFLAWKWGPVEPKTYNQFSAYNNLPIAQPSGRTTTELQSIKADTELRTLLDSLLPLAMYNPLVLSEITHENGAPWSKTPNLRPIEDNLIREYFNNEYTQ